MSHTRVRRTPRRPAAVVAAALLATLAAALVAGCGSLNSTGSSSAGTTRDAQVLYTVKGGDLVETASGMVTLTSTTKVRVTASVRLMGTEAGKVAAGQTVTVSFVKLPSGLRIRASGAPSAMPSGAPSPGSQSYGSGGASSGQSYGSGGAPVVGGSFGDQGGPGFLRDAKKATATVTAVQAGQNGSVTATITIAKLPSGVTAKYSGFAQITVKTLARSALIVPRAAIKGSGSSATVQLLQNGKTVTRSVTVGQQTATEAEITSGLSAGDSILYTRTFRGFAGARNSSGGYGGSGGTFQGGQGAPPSGGQGGYPPGQSNGQPTTIVGGGA